MGRRLGRLARGFVSKNIGEERFKETVRFGRERGETLKDALWAARRAAAEEWRAAEERRRVAEQEAAEEPRSSGEQASTRTSSWRPSAAWRNAAPGYIPRKYPPEVLLAYHKLDRKSVV